MNTVIESAFNKAYDTAESMLKYVERDDWGVFSPEDMLNLSGSQQTVYEAAHTLEHLLSQKILKQFVHTDGRHEVWGFVTHMNSYYKLKKYDGTFDTKMADQKDKAKYNNIIQEHCADIMTNKRHKSNFVIIADRYSDKAIRFAI